MLVNWPTLLWLNRERLYGDLELEFECLWLARRQQPTRGGPKQQHLSMCFDASVAPTACMNHVSLAPVGVSAFVAK